MRPKVDYSLRQAKHIERKMIFEALRRLFLLWPLDSYRYVGFGSIYFVDFSMAHKQLGITSLVSIEHPTPQHKRFEFNRPFECVTIKFKRAREALPELEWECLPSIVWLDYEGKVCSEFLGDINLVCGKATEGSMIVVTVNADARQTTPEDALTDLKSNVGLHKAQGVTPRDLVKWGLADVSQKIIANEIRDALSVRNGVLNNTERIEFSQLFNFRYCDSQRMLTVGGLLYSAGQQTRVDECAFEQFDFVRSGVAVCEIMSPFLTHREVALLDQLLPGDGTTNEAKRQMAFLDDRDIEAYTALYRYYPKFGEAVLH